MSLRSRLLLVVIGILALLLVPYLLWHEPMSWPKLGYVYAVSLAVLLLGHLCFALFRRSFAEVI